MIKIEDFEVVGWRHAIRGMRNPMNSWDKSDSTFTETAQTQTLDFSENPDGEIKTIFVPFDALSIGPEDHKLMMSLREGGNDHRKFMRMIVVYLDITAPLYWWKEFDTYKVGTVANSCSTMHKIHAKEFELSDFSTEHLLDIHDALDSDSLCEGLDVYEKYKLEGRILSYGDNAVLTVDDGERVDHLSPIDIFEVYIINALNVYRNKFLEANTKPMKNESERAQLKKKYWWQMIQLLPTSYNQKRTIKLNYEVLANIYKSRKNHKLDEWRTFCNWIEELPYSEIITGRTE